MESYVNVNPANTEKWAIMEQPTTSVLPGGIFVDCCIITVPQQNQVACITAVAESQTHLHKYLSMDFKCVIKWVENNNI